MVISRIQTLHVSSCRGRAYNDKFSKLKHRHCKPKGPATRNDFVNDIVDDERADAIFATLKTIVDDGSSTISSTISLRVAYAMLP